MFYFFILFYIISHYIYHPIEYFEDSWPRSCRAREASGERLKPRRTRAEAAGRPALAGGRGGGETRQTSRGPGGRAGGRSRGRGTSIREVCRSTPVPARVVAQPREVFGGFCMEKLFFQKIISALGNLCDGRDQNPPRWIYEKAVRLKVGTRAKLLASLLSCKRRCSCGGSWLSSAFAEHSLRRRPRGGLTTSRAACCVETCSSFTGRSSLVGTAAFREPCRLAPFKRGVRVGPWRRFCAEAGAHRNTLCLLDEGSVAPAEVPEAPLVFQRAKLESVDDWPMAIIKRKTLGGKPKPVAAFGRDRPTVSSS